MNAYTPFRGKFGREFDAERSNPHHAAHLALGVGLAGAAVALAFLTARQGRIDVFDIDYNAEHAEAVHAIPQTPIHVQPKPWLQMLWPPVFIALALSGLRVWNAPASPARTRALTLWSLLQGFNAAWMALGARRLGGAVTAGVAAAGATVAYAFNARQVEPPLTGMAAPYIGWMGLATLLNDRFWRRPRAVVPIAD